MKKILCLVSILFVPLHSIVCAEGGFEGKIVTPDLREPPQMVIKMTATRAKNTPQQITISDKEGNFKFKNLEQGKYLLEVYHNNELIRREVINNRETPEKEIRFDLQR